MAPSLVRVARTYGKNVAESWLEIQIFDLGEYAGVKEKPENTQIEQCARTIISQYGYLKVTELMVFFVRFKAGIYGRFYGAVDVLAITTALNDFVNNYRMAKIRAAEHPAY